MTFHPQMFWRLTATELIHMVNTDADPTDICIFVEKKAREYWQNLERPKSYGRDLRRFT